MNYLSISNYSEEVGKILFRESITEVTETLEHPVGGRVHSSMTVIQENLNWQLLVSQCSWKLVSGNELRQGNVPVNSTSMVQCVWC